MFTAVAAATPLLRMGCRENVVACRRSRRKASSLITRAAGGDGDSAGSRDDEDKEDDLPPPIKLSADQARIASLAFEVLYERDPVESLEELFVDKEERPGLRFRLTQAIKAANEACKDGATVECAAAWEEVDGLEDAAMRAGMSQNAPNSAYTTPPKDPLKKPTAEKKATHSKLSNPATKVGVDPLAGVMPCTVSESCEAPQGTFQKRAELEKLLEIRSENKAGADDASEGRLTDAIREAVDIAITMCENREDPSQCAVAWEVVEELSAIANKKKRDESESSGA